MIAVLAAACAPGFARGQVNSGEKVVLKPGATLQVSGRPAETGKAPRIYVVTRAKGEWRWLTSDRIGGWVRASDVVPLDRAVLETVAALITHGNAAKARGDLDRAIADYDEAMRLDPGCVEAQTNRGIIRQSRGDIDGAIADYSEAMVGGLHTAQVYNNRGNAWELRKDYGKAIDDYDTAIGLGPKYVLAWLNRGRARQATGDLDKALADYEAATRLEPQSPWGYALQASIFSGAAAPKFRDGPRAVELARKACDLAGPVSAYLCSVRADAHQAAGEPDAAAEWRAKAREAASKASAAESFAGRAPLKPGRQPPPVARPGSRSGGTPGGVEASIGYLSSIPGDYKGSRPVYDSGGSRPSLQPSSPTWLQQSMERTQAELRALERNKLELDRALERTRQMQEQQLLEQQQRRQQP